MKTLNRTYLKNAVMIFLSLFIACSCTYDKLDVAPDKVEDCETTLPTTVSFSKDVIPILVNNCQGNDCHSGNIPLGGINLEPSQAYATLLNKKSGYIDTINPKSSVLNLTLISQTNPMPPQGKLDDCTLEMIRKWMKQGAKNN